jgi:hypothetical protein
MSAVPGQCAAAGAEHRDPLGTIPAVNRGGDRLANLVTAPAIDQRLDPGGKINRDHLQACHRTDAVMVGNIGGVIERERFGHRPVDAVLVAVSHNVLRQRRIVFDLHLGRVEPGLGWAVDVANADQRRGQALGSENDVMIVTDYDDGVDIPFLEAVGHALKTVPAPGALLERRRVRSAAHHRRVGNGKTADDLGHRRSFPFGSCGARRRADQ